MKTQPKTTKYIFLIIGLIGYTLAGLNWNISIAGWLAPVFTLYFVKNIRWPGFLVLFLGLGLSAAISKTGENLTGLFFVYVTTGIFYGLINTLPYVIESLLTNREKNFYSTLIFPSAIVLIEYLLTLLLGIWGNLSIAQYHNFNLVQVTSLVGIYGVSFLVTWFASVINWIVLHDFAKNYIIKGIGIYAIVFIAVLLYGGIRTSSYPPKGETIKIGAVVGETDIHEVFSKWENEVSDLAENYDLEIPDEVFSNNKSIEAQIEKTNEALENGAKIVVWNEISLLLKRSQVDTLLLRIKELCTKNNGYVLIAFLEEDAGELPKPFNNKSILITPDGAVAWEYIKSNLHPVEGLINNKGKRQIPFIDTEHGRIGSAICYDIDHPGFMSQIGKNKIDIMLVPAFDWKGITPYHSNMAVFTAIQFGASIVRSNGKGITAFYDCHGNTIAQMNTFLSGSKITYAEIPVKSTTTVYSKIGDMFVYILILFLLFALGLRITKKHNL